MFRTYLAAALRNFAHHPLYTSINVMGLAVAFTAALLVAVFVRNEFRYERFIPGYDRTFLITETIAQPGAPPIDSDATQSGVAADIKLADPGVTVARLLMDEPQIRRWPGSDGLFEPTFAWVDADFFRVMPLPALSGDPKAALDEPDTVVITHRIARKYFGEASPIGQSLFVKDDPSSPTLHPLRVTAVLKDLPANTQLVAEVYASSRSAFSRLAMLDAHPIKIGTLTNLTYVRLAPSASLPALQRAVDVAAQPVDAEFQNFLGRTRVTLHPAPLAADHFRPAGTGEGPKPRGDRNAIFAITAVAVLLVAIASLNFVTLMTARATQRAIEVGVRKVFGARRIDLVIQFMGEALLHVICAAVVAFAVAELLIAPFGAFTQRDFSLASLHDPGLLLGIAAATLMIGLAAGIYPALFLSAFRPASVLKGGVIQAAGSGVTRQALVVVQFAVLTGLIMATATLYRQTSFALHQGQGADSQLIDTILTDCANAFPDEVRRLPGVKAAACASVYAFDRPGSQPILPVATPGGVHVNFDMVPVDFGFFELFGIKPLAGRLFVRSHGGDLVHPGAGAQPPVIINETAARTLGFASPGAAVGHSMWWPLWQGASSSGDPRLHASEIVGVVPDHAATVRSPIKPTFYFVSDELRGVVAIRLTGRDMAATVRAIDRLWKAASGGEPIREEFLSRFRLRFYQDIIVQSAIMAICAVLAVVIAGLGLFALSTFTAERRTKEIGIRKVMGASTRDIVWLLMSQFSLPVLLAIAIAWPVGFLLMDHWLHGFVQHVDVSPWTLILAAIAALAIAWLTVSRQAFAAAQAKPADALRYE